MQNGLKSNEWERIWVQRTFKIEIQKEGPKNSNILQNWFSREIRSPLSDFLKFQGSEKNTPESCRIRWNGMNNKEFGSGKPWKLKYRSDDQIIQTFCKIGYPKKLDPPSLICTNLKTLREVLLNDPEYIEMQWTTKNLGLENLQNLNTEVGTK